MATTCHKCLITFASLGDYKRHRPDCREDRIAALEAENAGLKARAEKAEGDMMVAHENLEKDQWDKSKWRKEAQGLRAQLADAEAAMRAICASLQRHDPIAVAHEVRMIDAYFASAAQLKDKPTC